MRLSRPSTVTKFRTQALRVVTAAALVASAVLVPVSASAAAPIVVDDFGGTQIAVPTIALSNGGGTSTLPTSTVSDGVHRFELFGDGNSATSAALDYTFAETDLTSAGSNTQFMVGLESVTRGPDLAEGQNAISAQITVTDATGATGQYSTGFSNVTDFDLVLNFECVGGSTVCFSGNVDFTRVTGVTLRFFYPNNYDLERSTVVVIDELRTTPTGGTQPPAPSPAITLATPTTAGTVWASGSTEVVYSVDFRSNGTSAEMATVNLSTSTVETRTTGSLNASIARITGSGSSYLITVGVSSGSGTLAIMIPAGAGTDTWNQPSTEVTSTPVLIEQGTVPIVENQSFTAHSGQAFEEMLTASGTPTPAFSALTALPDGLTLAADGTLSATDLAIGTHTFTVQATNPLGDDQATVAITVDELSFTSAPAAEFDTTTDGEFAVTWEAPEGTQISGYDLLPAGLTATRDGNSLVISGTPERAAAGVTVLPLTLTPPTGAPVTQDFSLTVNAPPFFTGPLSFTTIVDAPFSATVTSQGWPIASLALSGALPAGLDFEDNGDGTATISGATTGPAETSMIEVSADNGAADVSATLTFNVYSDAMIAPVADQSVEVGTAVTVPLETSGFPAPSVTAESLPDWITLTGNAATGWSLIASPAAAGAEATITLTATNPASSDSITVSFASYELPRVNGPESVLLVADESVPTDSVYEVTGSPTPHVEVAGLPDGVSTQIVDGAVALVGAPESAGSYSATITATNAHGSDVFTIAVTVDAVPEVASIAATEMPVGTPFGREVQATGQPTPVLTATDLPAGVTFTDHGDGTGTISGAPADSGESITTIVATNRSGAASAAFALTATASPVFVSGDAAGFEYGTASEFTIITEAYPTAALTLSGSLPTGLVFTDNGDGTATISGTASELARQSLQIVADNGSDAVEQTLVLTVWDAPSFTSEPLAAFTVGEEGQVPIAATGFPVPALTLNGALPAGLSFVDHGDGTGSISGTPETGADGTFEITLTATVAVTPPAGPGLMGFVALATGDIVATQELVINVAPAETVPGGSAGGSSADGEADALASTGGSGDWSLLGISALLLVVGLVVRRVSRERLG